MQTYSLIFDGDHGNTREIAKINALTDDGRSKPESGILDEARTVIASFCAERNFKIYYTRIWTKDGATVFDVGSHTEFFRLQPPINMDNLWDEVSRDEEE